jgi:hypothetical protein
VQDSARRVGRQLEAPRTDKAGTARFVRIVLNLGAFSSNFLKELIGRDDLFLVTQLHHVGNRLSTGLNTHVRNAHESTHTISES